MNPLLASHVHLSIVWCSPRIVPDETRDCVDTVPFFAERYQILALLSNSTSRHATRTARAPRRALRRASSRLAAALLRYARVEPLL